MKKVSFYSVEFQVFQRVYVLEAETYINQNSETIIERKSTKIDLHFFAHIGNLQLMLQSSRIPKEDILSSITDYEDSLGDLQMIPQ